MIANIQSARTASLIAEPLVVLAMGKKWIPLESNPEVLNQYAQTLGADVSKFTFCDVLGLDEVWWVVLNSYMQICWLRSSGARLF